MVQRKAGSGGVLRSVDDTCHGSRLTQNRKLAFLVLSTSGTTPSRQPHQSGRSHHCCCRSFPPGDVRLVVQRLRCYQQCRAVRDTARFVQWGSSLFPTSDPGLDPERLLTDDVSSACCSWQRWKNFNLALGRETYPHAVWLPHYSRNLPAIEGSIIAQVTNDIELEGHALSSGEDFQQWNVEACTCFAISVRFKGEGGGWKWH